MPRSAIPEWYVFGSDNQSWLMRLKKNWFQIPLAGGPRASGFWKWRQIPKTLFVLNGLGDLRYEDKDGEIITVSPREGYYLSRIQPWVRWHFAFLWPLCIQFHVIYDDEDVVKPPDYQSEFGIDRMFTITLGYSFESKAYVYWPTLRVGGNFE